MTKNTFDYLVGNFLVTYIRVNRGDYLTMNALSHPVDSLSTEINHLLK